jgi:hypothetical protein
MTILERDPLVEEYLAKGAIARRPKWSADVLFFKTTWETCFKLRQIKRWYWQTVQDYARHRRWNAKLPGNRRGDEPDYCAEFRGYTYSGTIKPTPQASSLGEDWLALYENARHPSTSFMLPWSRIDPGLITKIDLMYATLAEWFQEFRGEPDPLEAHNDKRAAAATVAA